MEDYGYQPYGSPASRPPEPPYSAGAGAAQRPYYGQQAQGTAPMPDTRGVDVPGEVPATGQQPPVRPEAGDTAQMPPSQGHHAQATAAPSEPAQKRSGAGKTFLFGFLGALLACALCLGGFAAWNAFAGGADKGGNGDGTASTLLGTTDPSVINAADEGLTLSEAVAAKALPSVVAVYNYQEQSSYYGYYGYGSSSGASDELVAAGMGSGVVISDEGYILTNYHVVEDAAELTVKVDGKERDAVYVGGDSSSDIAVVKVEDTEGLVAADIGDSDSLVIGEWVMTVGAPLGLEQSVATGVVSATNRSTIMDNSSSDSYGYYYGNTTPEYTYYPNMIQTDAVINPGNSGGALVDADGKLIGINSMLSSSSGNYAGVGFAIPINYAMSIAQDIIDGKEPTHAALGVSISQVNSQTAKRYNLSATSGAYIAAIYEGTGAYDSDLEVGDIITAIDGKEVTSTTDVTLDVREHKVGDTVTVTVNREGDELQIPVELTSDENLASATDDTQQQQQQQQQQSPRGNGYDMQELYDFLRMFGM